MNRRQVRRPIRKMPQGQRQHGQNPKELHEIEQLWRILGVLRPLYFLAPHSPTGRALGTFMLPLVRKLTVLTECVYDPSDPVDRTKRNCGIDDFSNNFCYASQLPTQEGTP